MHVTFSSLPIMFDFDEMKDRVLENRTSNELKCNNKKNITIDIT